MKNRRGAVTALLTIGALVVIGVVSVISSLGLKDKKTTQSRASEVKYGACMYADLNECKTSEICDNTSCEKCSKAEMKAEPDAAYKCKPKVSPVVPKDTTANPPATSTTTSDSDHERQATPLYWGTDQKTGGCGTGQLRGDKNYQFGSCYQGMRCVRCQHGAWLNYNCFEKDISCTETGYNASYCPPPWEVTICSDGLHKCCAGEICLAKGNTDTTAASKISLDTCVKPQCAEGQYCSSTNSTNTCTTGDTRTTKVCNASNQGVCCAKTIEKKECKRYSCGASKTSNNSNYYTYNNDFYSDALATKKIDLSTQCCDAKPACDATEQFSCSKTGKGSYPDGYKRCPDNREQTTNTYYFSSSIMYKGANCTDSLGVSDGPAAIDYCCKPKGALPAQASDICIPTKSVNCNAKTSESVCGVLGANNISPDYFYNSLDKTYAVKKDDGVCASQSETEIKTLCNCISPTPIPPDPCKGYTQKTCGDFCASTGLTASSSNINISLFTNNKGQYYESDCITPIKNGTKDNCVCKTKDTKTTTTFVVTNKCSRVVHLEKLALLYILGPSYWHNMNKDLDVGESTTEAFYECRETGILKYNIRGIPYEMRAPLKCNGVVYIDISEGACHEPSSGAPMTGCMTKYQCETNSNCNCAPNNSCPKYEDDKPGYLCTPKTITTAEATQEKAVLKEPIVVFQNKCSKKMTITNLMFQGSTSYSPNISIAVNADSSESPLVLSHGCISSGMIMLNGSTSDYTAIGPFDCNKNGVTYIELSGSICSQ